MRRIYLDNAATTPVRPAVVVAMAEAWACFGNPSSIHMEGQRARALVDGARRSVAELLGVRSERVVFVSGGTEGNNLALRGVTGRVLVSAVEHDCVLETAKVLGGGVIPVDANGVVRLEALEEALKRGGVALVSVMLANNETGVIQPVAEVAALARKYGALVHCDAVQAVGHMEVRPDDLGVDMMTVSAHKFGGPKGVGALVVRSEIQGKLSAQMTGGAQERNRRAGTENVAGIVGLGVACAEVQSAEFNVQRELMARLVEGLKALPVEIVAEGVEKVPHIVQVRVPGRLGHDVVMALDMAGVAASVGSACSSGRVKGSHVLEAMGFSAQQGAEGVRLSVGWATTDGDVAAGVAALGRVLK